MNQSTTTTGTKTKVKMVLLGDQHVGKSCIIQKYIHGKFDANSAPTVGIDFLAKNIFHKGKSFRLQLWDTAGQERYRSLIPSYLKDAFCAIIVYDITNRTSLVNAERWLRMYNDNKVNEGYSILVGNKTDIPERVVSTQEGKAMANKLKIGYYEVSAKTGDMVESMFLHLLDMLSLGTTNGQIGGMEHMNRVNQELDPSLKIKSVDETGQHIAANKTLLKNSIHIERPMEDRRIDRLPTQSAVVNYTYAAQMPPQSSAPFIVAVPTEQMLVRPLPEQNNIILNQPVQPAQQSEKKRRCCG